MKKRYLTLVLASVILGLSGCSKDEVMCGYDKDAEEDVTLGLQGTVKGPDAPDDGKILRYFNVPAGSESVDEKSSDMAALLFSKRTSGEYENAVMSPLSAGIAMGMLANGAAGQTADEILSFLGGEGVTLDAVNAYWGKLASALDYVDYREYMTVANSVWVHPLFPVSGSFSDKLKDTYRAAVYNLSDNGGNARVINEWVSKYTRGLIPSCVSQEPSGVLMLVNAVAMSSFWPELLFNKENTAKEDFKNADGQKVKADMMKTGFARASYRETDDFIAVSLSTEGQAKVEFILPKQDAPISSDNEYVALSRLMSAERTACKAKVSVPRFRLEMDVDLGSLMRASGVTSVFDVEKSDLSGIHVPVGMDNLFVGEMRQKSTVGVDEEGVVAGAVTTVEILAGSREEEEMPTIEIDFNRPFYFAIYPSLLKCPLFLGKVNRL